MKKSVIVLIGVIYVMAIFAVSFFGMKTKIYDEKIYIENIEITNDNLLVVGSEQYLIVDYDGEDTKVVITRRIYPDNATKKVVEYIYDETITYASVDSFGVVTFTRPGAITVYVTAKDGSAVSTSLTIIAR